MKTRPRLGSGEKEYNINGSWYSEDEISEGMRVKRCDGCKYSPEHNGGVFHLDCSDCTRFYSDCYEPKDNQ